MAVTARSRTASEKPPASAISVSIDPDLDAAVLALWNERRNLRAAVSAALTELDAAESRMPWWAKSGPRKLSWTGELCGGDCGWPAEEDALSGDLPARGVYRHIRHSPTSLRNRYEDELSIFPLRAKRLYVSRLRKLVARRRAQKLERERAGYAAASARYESVSTQASAITCGLRELEGFSLNLLAIKIVLGALTEASPTDMVEVALAEQEEALAMMRPFLTGTIAEDVAELLDNPEMIVSKAMAWV